MTLLSETDLIQEYLKFSDHAIDPYGSVMDAWFQTCEVMQHRGLPIPADWQYSNPTGHIEGGYWFDLMQDASDEAIAAFGEWLDHEYGALSEEDKY